MKVEPLAGVAVNVSDVQVAKLAEHVAAQLMPAGWLEMVPEPLPEFATDTG